MPICLKKKKKNCRKEMSSGNDFSKWSCLVTIENIQSPQILCFVQWVEGRGMEDLEEEE